MEDPERIQAGLRRAIALVTAWNESDEQDGDTSLAVGLVKEDLTQAALDERLVQEASTLIWGLMSLAGRLLLELERQSGVPIPTILQRAGEQAAGDYAELPQFLPPHYFSRVGFASDLVSHFSTDEK